MKRNKTKQLDVNRSTDYLTLLSEIDTESDRAAVILGAAKLDELLWYLLSRFVLPSRKEQDELFDSMRPVSSFGARIELAFRIGLIDADIQDALYAIKQIRNDFAHQPNAALDEESIQAELSKVLEILNGTSALEHSRRMFAHREGSHSPDMRAAMLALIVRLHQECNRITSEVQGPRIMLKPNG